MPRKSKRAPDFKNFGGKRYKLVRKIKGKRAAEEAADFNREMKGKNVRMIKCGERYCLYMRKSEARTRALSKRWWLKK